MSISDFRSGPESERVGWDENGYGRSVDKIVVTR